MVFSSYPFLLLFLPIALLGFWLLDHPERRRAAWGWLLGCSLFFYGYWNPPYLLLLLATMAGNLLIGRGLEQPDRSPIWRRTLLVVGVSANLGLLAYYKYANFFLTAWRDVTGSDWTLDNIILPLGISFFIFQQIGYVVDRYRGQRLEYSWVEYCLFVTFFPQLIAGPIVDHRAFIPQLKSPLHGRLTAENLAVGLTVFLIGLLKKVVLADRAGDFVGPIYDTIGPEHLPTFAEAWIATVAYTFQLYFDFSGYSDMAIGLGRMFGLQLPVNFNSPYKATSIIDFWRRWHITLSAFLREFLYIPLGGNRHGEVRRYLHLFVTMLLGGLWHGAGWNFLLWGGLHGGYLCVNHAWRSVSPRLAWPGRWMWTGRMLGGVLTFLAVMLGWVLFRSKDLASAGEMLSTMMGVHGWEMKTVFRLEKAIYLIALLSAVTWLMPNTHQLLADFQPAHFEPDRQLSPLPSRLAWMAWRPDLARALLFAATAILVFVNLNRLREFLYFQF